MSRRSVPCPQCGGPAQRGTLHTARADATYSVTASYSCSACGAHWPAPQAEIVAEVVAKHEPSSHVRLRSAPVQRPEV